jgi:hypothetical protein
MTIQLDLQSGLEGSADKTRTLGMGMEVCEDTYDMINASVGLSLRLNTASELMRHTESTMRGFQSFEGQTASLSFLFCIR